MKTNNKPNTAAAIFNMAHSTIAHPNEVLFNPDSYDNSSELWQDMSNAIKALVNNGYDIIVWQQFGVYVISYDFSEDELSSFSASWIPKEDDPEEEYFVADFSLDDPKLERSANESLKCPFCGCEVVVKKDTDKNRWFSECLYCGTKTPALFYSKEEAADFWNGEDLE